MAENLPNVAYFCADCDHLGKKHTVYVGPCSQCWAELKPICKQFRLKDEDYATVKAEQEASP